jgi:hypothetical protein
MHVRYLRLLQVVSSQRADVPDTGSFSILAARSPGSHRITDLHQHTYPTPRARYCADSGRRCDTYGVSSADATIQICTDVAGLVVSVLGLLLQIRLQRGGGGKRPVSSADATLDQRAEPIRRHPASSRYTSPPQLWPEPTPPQVRPKPTELEWRVGMVPQAMTPWCERRWVLLGIGVVGGVLYRVLRDAVLRMPTQRLIFSVVLLVIASSILLFLLLRGGYRERPLLMIVFSGLVGASAGSIV